MKNQSLLPALALCTFFALSCSTVPITGRQQLDLVPAGEMMAMSYQQYDQFLKENKLSTDQKQTETVKRVGLNIQHAVEGYFAEHNLKSELDGFAWEFNLVESKEVNAWCMPGGKVVFYTSSVRLLL
jgi:predicted Zn-dependent protease